jgi:hypothetical protein
VAKTRRGNHNCVRFGASQQIAAIAFMQIEARTSQAGEKEEYVYEKLSQTRFDVCGKQRIEINNLLQLKEKVQSLITGL